MSGGCDIIIDASSEANPRLIRLYLLGPILAPALHQRGLLVLHASAIRIDGQAIAFVGDKGMGKSTMAAAFRARGYSLVADDLVAIDISGDVPMAYPGFPQLKLFPGSAALLDPRPGELPKVHPELDKRSCRSDEGFRTDRLPLREIHVFARCRCERGATSDGRSGVYGIGAAYVFARLPGIDGNGRRTLSPGNCASRGARSGI